MPVIDEVVELQGEFEAETEKLIEQGGQNAANPEVDNTPARFKGKDLNAMYKDFEEMEKKASRLGNEVHEVRTLADELIKSQLTRKAEVQKPEPVDFFENPQEAMRHAIENNPRVKFAEESALNAQRQLSLQTILQRHPDLAQINQSPDFQEWVGKSKIRQKLYQDAQNFDVESGDELLSTFKELRKSRVQQVSQVEVKARDTAMQAASVETSGTQETTRKVYRRADLIRLKMKDPAKYEAMADEIYTAYDEGRVR